MAWYSSHDWRPYVSAADRRKKAARTVAGMKRSGREVSPIEIAGRKIAQTFWGDAWCRNLEAYSDYENRLPRGRTYVRNGSVIDLQIDSGSVRALVSGTDLYEVEIEIKPLPKRRWGAIKNHCAGHIDSLIELLRGSVSKHVMEIVTREREGLFPSPREISLSCSCPDWANMCKHVAAALYGVGARLDHHPASLFVLRGVDPAEMVEAAASQIPSRRQSRNSRILAADELSVFGIDIEGAAISPTRRSATLTTQTARKGKKRRTSSATAARTAVRTAALPRKKAATRKAATRQVAVKESATKTVATRKANTRKVATKHAATRTATAEKEATQNVVTKKARTQKVAIKKTATEKGGEAAPAAGAKKVAIKKLVAEKVSTEKAAIRKVVARNATTTRKKKKKAKNADFTRTTAKRSPGSQKAAAGMKRSTVPRSAPRKRIAD